jgi:hypothetical protein
MITETITITDFNAGNFVCTTTTGPSNITYSVAEDVTLTIH